MTFSIKSSIPRLVCAAVFLALVCHSTAWAQTPTTFLTRSAFTFSWAGLASSDPRFSSAAELGLNLDVADYKVGRVNFVADYEAVLGSERRSFELNHGNYTLESSASYRLRATEIAGAFHHVSRHLSDRPNPNVIAWNVLDLRAARHVVVRGSAFDAQLAWGHVLQRTYVDYVWTGDLRLGVRRQLSPRVSVFAKGSGGLVGVDRAKLGRDRLCGSRVEAGVRLNGESGALELYAGYERRIDAYPLDRQRARWFAFGFRLVSR